MDCISVLKTLPMDCTLWNIQNGKNKGSFSSNIHMAYMKPLGKIGGNSREINDILLIITITLFDIFSYFS